MKPRHSNLTLPSVAMATLALAGTSFAATLFGLAQPGWEDDPDPGPPIHTDPYSDGTSINEYFIYNTLYGLSGAAWSQTSITNWGTGFVVSDAGLTSESSVQFQIASPEAAVRWLSVVSLLGSGTISSLEHLRTTPLSSGNSPQTLQTSGNTFSSGSDWNLITDSNLGSDWNSFESAGFATYRDSAALWMIDGIGSGTNAIQIIPEPSTITLIGLFAGSLMIRRRKPKALSIGNRQ
jgi:hypothetical protein